MSVEIFPYVPKLVVEHDRLPNVPTSWNGLERIIPDIIRRFCGGKSYLALEFGVWHGYSTAALANHFRRVIGVDIFEGDLLAGTTAPMLETTAKTLEPWPNIELRKESYQRFFTYHYFQPELIHIDILHTYEDTFACGAIALTRAECVIFHDTISFTEVRRAVGDLSQIFGRKFYNYYDSEGLGILARTDAA
jgi:hypothetical protein